MRRALVVLGVVFGFLTTLTTSVRADANRPVYADRVAVRFVTPETGGAATPRFVTEREVAFFARIEATLEQTPLENNEYPERYVRSAVDRFVARTMLARLAVGRGTEPPEFSRLTSEARAELADRLGGPVNGAAILADVMKKEGIDEDELTAFLRDQVRATHYVDKAITPIVTVTEEQLREAFRSTIHPFSKMKFDDARARLRRWLVMERLRAAEVEFLQGARARIEIVSVLLPAKSSLPVAR